MIDTLRCIMHHAVCALAIQRSRTHTSAFRIRIPHSASACSFRRLSSTPVFPLSTQSLHRSCVTIYYTLECIPSSYKYKDFASIAKTMITNFITIVTAALLFDVAYVATAYGMWNNIAASYSALSRSIAVLTIPFFSL
jgi:hypothetical protein